MARKMKHDRSLLERLLKELTEERKNIRQFSNFGDNNWASLDEQIRVLEYFMDLKVIPMDYNDSYELVTDLVNFLRGDDASYIEFLDWEDKE